MKTISFAIPCYNSAAYMDKCIESCLACGEDIEVIIVDDGSTKDETPQKADEWQRRYPDIVKVVHQENGGHGAAVNAGLAAAEALYFKVVDSDDWLDADAMAEVMAYLRRQIERRDATDLVVANYVYEKVFEDKRTAMRYRNVFPVGKEFGWRDIGHFSPSQYLLMHSVIYRTELLKDMGLALPEHCSSLAPPVWSCDSPIFTSLKIPRLSTSSRLRSLRFSMVTSPPVLLSLSAMPAIIPRKVLSMPVQFAKSSTTCVHPFSSTAFKKSAAHLQFR